MKYINQLGIADWIQIHEAMFPHAEFKRNHVFITQNLDEDRLEVSFMECWDGGEGKLFLRNTYYFKDFDTPICPDCIFSKKALRKMKHGFYTFMFARFKTMYMRDFILEKTDVDMMHV